MKSLLYVGLRLLTGHINVRSRFQHFHEFGKVNPFMLYFYHEYMDTRYMVNNGAEVENVIV